MRTLHMLAFAGAISAACFAAPKDQGSEPGADPAPDLLAAASAADGVTLVEATVRHGTVMVGDHPNETPVGPGGKVLLPEADVAALRKRGVLHDPEGAPVFAAGPKIDIDTVGPTVAEG